MATTTDGPQTGGPRNTNLLLGTSEGFRCSYDLWQPYGERVDDSTISLGGKPIDPAASYRVAADSFPIGGGDTFGTFTRGTNPATGPVDVETAVQYFQRRSPVGPPPADHSTRIG